MISKYGFTRMTIDEFENWLPTISVSRYVGVVQQHHTWSPRYAQFSGNNHLELQRGMRNHHVNDNGWADIGQHFSIFPDGDVVTGRPLNRSPACISGNNARSICIENVGNFDSGEDQMTAAQREAIIRATAALARRFNLNPVTTDNIVYHHWFDLNTGHRTNGGGVTKTCPGTAFFGGNSVAACRTNFLPLVQQAMAGGVTSATTGAANVAYGCVTADSLNVRTQPTASASLAADQEPLQAGAIVRIFARQGGWMKIANSKLHWVYGNWVKPVTRRTVTANDTSVRAGPATSFEVLNTLGAGSEVFVHTTSGNWSRIGLNDMWINSSLLA